MAAAFYLGDQVEILPGTYDQISYHNLALRVVDGYGFSFGETWWPQTAANAPTAHWSYLYTAYLVVIYSIFGPYPIVARLIQAVLVGIAQPLLAYLIGRRVFSENVGLVAAALTAVYAYFIYYSATLMTEPFYITAIMLSLYLAILIVDHASESDSTKEKRKIIFYALGLGISLGIAVLLRQLIFLIVPFIFLWIWFACRKKRTPSPLPMLAISGLVIILMILPFTFYNYLRFDRFILLNTNAGYAFYWSNHPIYGTHYIPLLPPEISTYPELVPENLRQLDEAALDQELLKLGIQLVIQDPVRYALLSISRIPVYFMFWPSPDSGTISNISRVSSFGWLWPFMLYGVILVFIRKSPEYPSRLSAPTFLLLLIMGIYSAIHLLSWALIRYRLPVDAILLIFAGFAIVDLTNNLRNRRRVSTRKS